MVLYFKMKERYKVLINLFADLWRQYKYYNKTARLYRCLSNVTKQLNESGFGGYKEVKEEITYTKNNVLWIRETRLPVIETKDMFKVSQIPGYPVRLRCLGNRGLKTF